MAIRRNPIEDLRPMSIMSDYGLGNIGYGIGWGNSPESTIDIGGMNEDQSFAPPPPRPRPILPPSIYVNPFKPYMPPGIGVNSGLPSAQQPEQPSTMNMFDIMRQQYKPETEATNRFNRLLDAPPERQNPSIARRLVASGSALRGGIPAARAIMDEPYRRDVEEWKIKADPYYQAANLERQANATERQLVGQMAQYQTQADRYALEARDREEKNRISDVRAQAYAYDRYLGKGYEFDFSGPTVTLGNKTTGDVIRTGIETGKLDERSRLELQNYGRLKAMEAAGQNALTAGATYVVGPDGRLIPVNPRTTPPTPPENIPPGSKRLSPSGGGGGSTSLEDARQRNAKFQAVADEFGKEYEEFMTPPATVNGNWQLKPPQNRLGWNRGPDPEKVRKYNELLGLLGIEKRAVPNQQQPVPNQQTPAPAPQTQSNKSWWPSGLGGFGSAPAPIAGSTQPVPVTPAQPIAGSNQAPTPPQAPVPEAPRRNDVLGYEQGVMPYPLDPSEQTPWIFNKAQQAGGAVKGTYNEAIKPPTGPAEPNVYTYPALRQKAKEYLQMYGKPVDDANIEWVIRTGKVR